MRRRSDLNSAQQSGLWFEEYQPGLRLTTAGRTITEADVVNFAGVSGDFSSLHVDEAYSRSGPYQQRIAHGLLVLSVASGLLVQTGILGEAVGTFRGIEKWKFAKPVYLGDTVTVVLNVKKAKAAPALGGGFVKVAIRVQNQHEQDVMRGIWSLFVKSGPSDQ